MVGGEGEETAWVGSEMMTRVGLNFHVSRGEHRSRGPVRSENEKKEQNAL